MSNRTQSGGASLGNVKSRTSLTLNSVANAAATLPLSVSGTTFYLATATAPIEIRPSGGVWNLYEVGTGLELEEVNAFSLLEVRNPNPYPVAFSIFCGFDRYLDKRLILASSGSKIVARPTYPVPNTAAAVEIDDISGQQFADVNGGLWYAVQRVALIISNTDGGVDLLLQESGSAVANGPAVAAVFAKTSLRLEQSGDYSLSTGGGNINAVVSELYQAIPKT